MDHLTQALLFSSIAGLMIPLGSLMASREHIRSDWLETEFRHSVIAFGGGVLVAAVALVLVPEGTADLPAIAALLIFVAGGATFAVFDALLAKSGKKASQLVAMLADFIPESLALGAMFAVGSPKAKVLALLIALQNLPEAFNAYRESVEAGVPSKRIIWISAGLALTGPAFAAIGVLFLGDATSVVGAIMMFAAGGILYLVFQDIAPQAQIANRWGPTTGAVAGFALGLAGHLLI